MLGLGAPQILVLPVAVLVGLGSRRLPIGVGFAGDARRALRAGTRIPAGDHPERVGLSLRQIQIRSAQRSAPGQSDAGGADDRVDPAVKDVAVAAGPQLLDGGVLDAGLPEDAPEGGDVLGAAPGREHLELWRQLADRLDEDLPHRLADLFPEEAVGSSVGEEPGEVAHPEAAWQQAAAG